MIVEAVALYLVQWDEGAYWKKEQPWAKESEEFLLLYLRVKKFLAEIWVKIWPIGGAREFELKTVLYLCAKFNNFPTNGSTV